MEDSQDLSEQSVSIKAAKVNGKQTNSVQIVYERVLLQIGKLQWDLGKTSKPLYSNFFWAHTWNMWF